MSRITVRTGCAVIRVMTDAGSFHELKVWREAMMLVEEVYRVRVAVSGVRASWSDTTDATGRGVDRIEYW